jgi:4-hydroxy-L-threonine phosphate dehydrogenase PdxA
MGDPASIGPEIAVKALLTERLFEVCRPVIIGDAAVFEAIVKRFGSNAKINAITDIKDAKFVYGEPDVYDLKNVDMSQLKFGEISAMAGDASFQAVKKVIELALAGDIDATVTGPINKKSVNEAGHHFAGHTEIYAHYTNTKKYAMLLVEDHMKVIHVSTHVSLRKPCDLVKKDRILEVTELLHNGLISLRRKKPEDRHSRIKPARGRFGLIWYRG